MSVAIAVGVVLVLVVVILMFLGNTASQSPIVLNSPLIVDDYGYDPDEVIKDHKRLDEEVDNAVQDVRDALEGKVESDGDIDGDLFDPDVADVVFITGTNER